MVPLIVLVVSVFLFRAVGAVGVQRFRSWKEATVAGLAVMLFFTASAHFTSIRHDLAAMIPPPLTGAMWLIYLTGVLEIAGAVGLLIPRFRRAAGICLILLLVALLPANIYAAMANVPLRGNDPTPLAFRIPLQIFWIALLWWSAVARPIAAGAASPPPDLSSVRP